MSDFWSKVLGEPQQQQNRAPLPQPLAGEVPWWQRSVVPVTPVAPSPQVPQQPEAAPQPALSEQEIAAQSLSRTQWAKQSTGNCPNCGSDNYSAHPSQPNSRPRCYSCGYPITQSGSGVTLKGEAAGPVQPARQTAASKTNNFNPAAIFDRIG